MKDMRNRRHLAAALLAGTALLTAAPAMAEPVKAEVMHWWTSGAEAKALQVLVSAYEAQGGQWVDHAVPDFESAVAAATSAIIGGNPPDALQFNAGAQFADLAAQGYLTDLTGYAAAGDWAKALPPALMQAISHDGKVYAMPVDNHGENWLWVSNAALARAGVGMAQSWDEFFPMLDKLKAAGIIPFAHGGESWQELELFYQVMMFRGDTALYDALFVKGDTAAMDTPEFAAFAADFRKLSTYADPGAPGRKWNDATAMVIKGEAAMQFMGDWAKGEFLAAGQEPGKDFQCLLGLGTAQHFVISADVFVLPATKRADAAAAHERLVNTFMDPGVQVAFNRLKGGLPARLDADPAGLDACAAKGLSAMQDPAKQVGGPEIVASADRIGAIQDVVAQFWNTPEMSGEDFGRGLVDALDMTAE